MQPTRIMTSSVGRATTKWQTSNKNV